jgi:tetratricopeptide (TPR) repeat protein
MKAYPNAIEQQRYLQDLIRNKPITAANLRLGHLLLQSSVAKILITPNFDDFASRAIAVFGETVIRVCDHPATVERVNPEDHSIQIVHVHGTYRYYDLANLKPQIESRAEGSRSTAFTMLSLLDRIFVNHSPLVIGYSGWEGDVIMTALKRRLATGKRLPYRLFWFCYQADATDTLPDWLKNHEDVIFVKSAVAGPSAAEEKVLAAATTRIEASDGPSQHIADKPTLPAQRVFDELIRELSLDAPEIVRDPLSFLARQLRATISGEEYSDRTSTDPYSLASVVRRIARAQRLESEASVEVEVKFEKVRDAVRRSSYSEAILSAGDIRISGLDEPHSGELVKLMTFAFNNPPKEPAERELNADRIVSICKKLPQEAANHELDLLLSGALSAKARALLDARKLEESISVWDEVIDTFLDSEGSYVQRRVNWAMEWKGTSLAELDRDNEAIDTFDALLARLDFASPPSARLATWAMLDKARVLRKLRRVDDTLAILSELDDAYKTWSDEEIVGNVARGLERRVDILAELRRDAEALELVNEFTSRFGESGMPHVKTQMSWVLQTKAEVLSRSGNVGEAASTLDDVITGALDSNDRDMLATIRWAVTQRADLQIGSNEPESALELADNILARVQSFNDLHFQRFVGEILLKKAHILRSLGRRGDCLAVLDDITTRFASSQEPSLLEFAKQADVEKASLDSGAIAASQ